MATAAQVINTSLKRILVQGAEADLQPDEYEDAIFAMNALVLAWDAEGINLGYTWVNDLGDEVTVPTGALRGLIANLAIEIAPDYNGEVSTALAKAAERGMTAIRLLGQSIPTSFFPCTLPVGSGNSRSVFDRTFYPCSEEEILAETTGAISLETGTDAAADSTVPVVAETFIFLDESDVEYQVPLSFLGPNSTTYAIPATFLDADDASYPL